MCEQYFNVLADEVKDSVLISYSVGVVQLFPITESGLPKSNKINLSSR